VTGFSTGRRADPASSSLGISDNPKLLPAVQREAASIHQRTYFVSDIDAHAWVEAWFPGYGWVTFDPTPPTGQGQTNTASLAGGAAITGFTPKGREPASAARRAGAAGGLARARRALAGSPSGGVPAAFVVAAALAALAAGAMLARALWRQPDPLAELECAFARCGRPLEGGATLALLERRLADSPAAADYVRELRLARYAAASIHPPSPAQRRALRGRLARGRGPIGRLRALWALPPRPAHRRRR